jgi:hypothetical protein
MAQTLSRCSLSVCLVLLLASLSACGGKAGNTEMEVYRLMQAGEHPCESADVELHFLGEEWARYNRDAGPCGTMMGAARGHFTREGSVLSLYAGETLTARGWVHGDTLRIRGAGSPSGEYVYVRQNARP